MPIGAAFDSARIRLFPFAAVFVLLLLPVDLRAGLPAPHPHALFQIIDDAADGAIDHDHGAIDQGYGVHHHEREATAPAPTETSPDMPRVAEDGEGVGSGLTAALPSLRLPPPAGEAGAETFQSPPPSTPGPGRKPPIPPPRSAA